MQEQSTQSPQEAVGAPVTVNITIPVESINLVLNSLAKQPFEAVADLITTIRTQAITQLEELKRPGNLLPSEGAQK